MEKDDSALQGIKVLDFSWVVAGPLATKFLADYGAQVIKIESRGHPDLMRLSNPYKGGRVDINRSGPFVALNSSKYSLALNLNHPRASDVVRKLVDWADIVVENFEPGTMDKWGWGYEEFKKINPDIIMMSISSFGQSGVGSRVSYYGFQIGAMAGLYHLTGWGDGEPRCPALAYPDYVTATFAAMTLVLALEHRRRTGHGQYVDLSMFESTLQFLAPAMLRYTFNGDPGTRMGNRCSYAAPHGVYRCRGEDRWCAIAVFDDPQWHGFCKAVGDYESWIEDTRFATLPERKNHEDELDASIEQWTMQRSPEEVMEIMQLQGVPASIVENGEDLVDKDPQIRDRKFFVPLQHPTMGQVLHRGWPAKLSQSSYHLGPAPVLGQHSDFVLTQILGLSSDEVADLMSDGVLK